ncbi:hypothetical protein PMAYCL1PPCAC_28875, partial [Pristionchus mayeri]
DPQLLEGIQIEDLESCNVQNADEAVSRQILCIESLVAPLDEPVEHTGIQSLSEGSHRPIHL